MLKCLHLTWLFWLSIWNTKALHLIIDIKLLHYNQNEMIKYFQIIFKAEISF